MRIPEMIDPRDYMGNVELRATLEKAANDAKLNVTERMALNEMFYPNGGGFELFPKNNDETPTFIYYCNKDNDEYYDSFVRQENFFGDSDTVPDFLYCGKKGGDSFTRKVDSVTIPENITMVKTRIVNSEKSNFRANLEKALTKLENVLKGDI